MGKPDPALLARAQSLLENCELVNVRLTEFSARLHDGAGTPDFARVGTTTKYACAPGLLANRYQWSVDLVDEQGEVAAELTATLELEYRVSESFEPDDEAAGFFAATTGFFAAYPYAREILQSNTARLQLDPMVLGLLPRGAQQPRLAHAIQP